jgi:hypothetical protein
LSDENSLLAHGPLAELTLLRQLVQLHQQKDAHFTRCAEIQRRIAQDEKDIGILLLEANKYKEAARQRAEIMQQDRLREKNEQQSYEQKQNMIADLQSQIAYLRSGIS